MIRQRSFRIAYFRLKGGCIALDPLRSRKDRRRIYRITSVDVALHELKELSFALYSNAPASGD